MAHLHSPSDTEDTTRLSDLSLGMQARVRARASCTSPVNPPIPAPDFQISQSFDQVHLDQPNYDVPGAMSTCQTADTYQRNLSGSLFMQTQTQQNHGRGDSPTFPLRPVSFQRPRPSSPPMNVTPMLAPPTSTHQPSTAPFTTASTPTAPTSNLLTLPAVQLPAIGPPRPVVQKRKTGSKIISANAKKKKKGVEGQAIDVEESAQEADDQAGDELTALIRDLKSDLVAFRVDLPTPFVVTAEGEAKGDTALAIRSLAQFVTDQMTLVRGGLLLLATRVSTLEAHLKTSRKVPKGERSDQENEVHKYIQSEIHTVVQELLHWKPSDGFGALPCEGDKYIDEDSGEEVEISAPQWDERIDTAKNVNWITTVTTLIEGNIKADIEGNDKLKETLQGVPISKHIEETLKGYIRHLKTNWAKARMDPNRMKRERRRGRRNARQREESLRMCRMLDNLNAIVAKSAKKLGITETVTIKEQHLLPDIFSEEESGPEDDTPESVRVFAEYGGPLQVGEFYLTHPKPYLSPAATDLKSLARMIYKSRYVRPTNCKKRIEGPASNLLPPDLRLEDWMVDTEQVPEGALTFLKDSVPSDQIEVIMKDALHTWNKDTTTSAFGYDTSKDKGSRSGGSTDKVEGGSGFNSGGVAEGGTCESEED